MQIQEIVDELLSQDIEPGLRYSFLSGLLKAVASLSIECGTPAVELVFEDSGIALYALRVLNAALNARLELAAAKGKKSANKFTITVGMPQCLELLERSGIAKTQDGSICEFVPGLPESVRGSTERLGAYLRGLFLVRGKLFALHQEPDEQERLQSAGYRLELYAIDESVAADICEELNSPVYQMCDIVIKAHVAERSKNTFVYIGDASSISDFLALIGAGAAVAELQNIVIERSLKNIVNRRKNCDYANVSKAVEASARQQEAIVYLEEHGMLADMDERLRSIAQLRMEQPEATVDELATQLGISKSGAYHRLNKLVTVAEEMMSRK